MSLRADYIKLLGPSGFSQEGVLASIPASGVCYVVCKAGPAIEKIDWVLQANRNHSYQLFRMLAIPSSLASVVIGSLANTETILIQGNTYTGATSTTTWSTGGISVAGTDAADATLLQKAINGGTVVTLASVEAGDTVVVTDATGTTHTLTAHADTTTEANGEFSISGTDAQDAGELVKCVTGDYALSGITVTQGAATGEVLFQTTADYDSYPDVESSNGTRLAVSTIGHTYLCADISSATLTLRWRDALVDRLIGNCPSFFTAKTGTATTHAAFTDTLLTSLQAEAAQVTGLTDNSTTGGQVYTQTLNGAPFGVLAVTNADGSNANIVRVSAYKVPF